MKWADDAEKAVSRVPFFVRKRVRKRVEEEASRQGATVVLLQHVKACQKQYMDNMESEVKGYQVENCFGPGGCPNRAVSGEGIADGLEAMLKAKNIRDFLLEKVQGPLKLHHEFRVSVSDCPNGCSRPQIADIGIIGACEPRIGDSACTFCEACVDQCREEALQLEPQRGPILDEERCLWCGQCVQVCPSGTLTIGLQGYRVQVGGKLGRHPQLGRELTGIHTKEGVLRIVERYIDHYLGFSRSGERLGEVLNRIPLELLEDLKDC